jgi:hypothetical protein
MTCLIWRQHRGQALWTVITVTALCALIVSYGLSAEHWLAGYHAWLRQLAAAGCPMTSPPPMKISSSSRADVYALAGYSAGRPCP